MFTLSSRLAALALGAAVLAAAAPSSAQVYGYQPGGAQDFYGYQQGAVCGDRCGDYRNRSHPDRRYDRSYQGQVDRPGDYRCDAYWDRGRTDCDARWRDQRTPWRRNASHGYRSNHGGPAAYYGEYGRPDVIYSGGSYGGYHQGSAYPDPYGHDHGAYAGRGRDPQRINWCCAEYRSYDPSTGYYTAWSGQRIFCG